MTVPPGSTIGIIGGGQLGRMLGLAAAQLGYRTHIYSPEASGPATEVAAAWTRGAYDDQDRIEAFGKAVDVVTYEFENVDPAAVALLGRHVPVWPQHVSLEVSRYRPAEKQLAADLGGDCAPFRQVDSIGSLHRAIAEIGTPAILKTSMFGYDGKGQVRIDRPDQADQAWAEIGSPPAHHPDAWPVLERRIDFIAEFSVLLCRGRDGVSVTWDIPENRHESGILATSTVPASPEILAQADEAVRLTRAIADRLGHVGMLTCEFFATADGPVFNEMAPRVHNSGHWTIEGAITSQFENHIRGICELPLGDTTLTAPRVRMRNLLGAEAADWRNILSDPRAHLHLYGKREAEPGRKMGHVTWVA